MLKKFSLFLFVFFLVVSCTYFENKAKKEPVQEVDTIVDFNSVDAFPLFPNCKDIPSRKKQMICFQMEMSQHINASLKAYEFNAADQVNDTVMVRLKIDTKGKTSLSGLQMTDEVRTLLPQFDSIVQVSLNKLPLLEPAIKRAIPVTIEFVLPIILTGEQS